MVKKAATTGFLIILAAGALYLCYLIAKPFLTPIFGAIVLAIVFYPMHTRIESWIRQPSLAATVTTILVMITVSIPAVFIGMAVTGEVGDMYESLSRKSAEEGGLSVYLMNLLEKPLAYAGRYVDLSPLNVRATLLEWLENISGFLVAASAAALGNVFSLIFGIVVAFFTLFFLFRDGPAIQQAATSVLPLSSMQSRRLFKGISDTIVASVYGGLAVGLVQGLLTSLAFLVLGLSSPVLWGVVAAVTSLLPVVGTGIVWVPAAIALLISGHWVKALILMAWGAAIVAQVDTLVRPYVVSGRTKMHNLLIFFALLGGAQTFGIMGLIIGPVVVSITIAVLDMLREINTLSSEMDSQSNGA